MRPRLCVIPPLMTRIALPRQQDLKDAVNYWQQQMRTAGPEQQQNIKTITERPEKGGRFGAAEVIVRGVVMNMSEWHPRDGAPMLPRPVCTPLHPRYIR